MSNRDVFKLHEVVQVYQKENDLLGPEQTILNIFKDQWKNWRMLDLGIGAGRTTAHFAPIVKEYTGIDYSEEMVAECEKACLHFGPNVKIRLGDARSMPEFETGQFDFVMFSFNGLDDLAHYDRVQTLQEMKRVGKPGGHIFFSSHNLQYIPNMYKIRHNNSLRYFAYRCYRSVRLLYHNGLPGRYKGLDFATFKDDVHQFRIDYYYAKPAVVVAQLKKLGLKNIRVFPSKTQGEIDIATLDTVDQYGWLHYLCEI